MEDEGATQEVVDKQLNSLQDAILALKEVEQEDPDQDKVDKRPLQNLLTVAKSYKEANYTKESFDNLKGKMNEEESALKNDELKQEEIDAVLKTLQDAINDLKTYEIRAEIETKD